MARFSVCYLALVALAIVAKEACADAPERIVGGQVAAVGEFPYQVSLRKRNSHFCGGSIISERHILTAAHCVENLPMPYIYYLTVVTGTNSLKTGGEVHKVKSISIHPEYKGAVEYLWINDIAVILLDKPIKFNEVQKPIELLRTELPPKAHLRLSGWGRTSAKGSISESLLKTDMYLQDESTCRSVHAAPIESSQICALNKVGIGACQGDSGGPLTYNGQVAGVVSWVIPCAHGISDIFTKVSSHINFIETAMKTLQ